MLFLCHYEVKRAKLWHWILGPPKSESKYYCINGCLRKKSFIRIENTGRPETEIVSKKCENSLKSKL